MTFDSRASDNTLYLSKKQDKSTEPLIRRAKHDKEHPFVQVSRSLIRDHSLSFRARGLLTFLLSFPSDWQVHPKHLAKEAGIGKDQIYSILKELIEAGYCKFTQQKSSKGSWSSGTYEFSENPEFKNCLPRPGFPDTEVPDPVKPDYTKKVDNEQKDDLIDIKREDDLIDFQHGKKGRISKSKDAILEALKKKGHEEGEILEAIERAQQADPVLNGEIANYLEAIIKKMRKDNARSSRKTNTRKSNSIPGNDKFAKDREALRNREISKSTGSKNG